MRSSWIGTPVSLAVALLLGCGPALALGNDLQFAGLVGAGGAYYLQDGKKHHTYDWLANGSAVLTVDNPGFNVQVNVSNNYLQIPSPSDNSDAISYGGDVFWRDYAGSFGINANFVSPISTGSASDKPNIDRSFGLFGEWFALPDLTLQLKGGRFEGHYEGFYADSAAVIYPYKDIALSATADYADAEHIHENVKDAFLKVEYLPVHDVPVSLYLGFDYSLMPHQQVSVLLVGLTAYLGGGGRSGTLIDYRRNNAVSWDKPPATLLQLGF